MAKEDFCFTYYDGDAARDKAHMTRLQRGAYDDLISAQRKRGHLSIDDIKRVLSKDFDECWPALEWILKTDTAGKYFIEWVETSIEKMRKNSKKQKEKANSRWGKYRNDTTALPQNDNGINPVIPIIEYGNENEDEIGNEEIGGVGDFEISLDLQLPPLTLEAAERNQYALCGNRNTEFLKKQWEVFIAERIHDPPEKKRQYYQLSDLTTYFLNWVRNKHPNATNQRSSSGGNSTKPGTSEARINRAKEWGRKEV